MIFISNGPVISWSDSSLLLLCDLLWSVVIKYMLNFHPIIVSCVLNCDSTPHKTHRVFFTREIGLNNFQSITFFRRVVIFCLVAVYFKLPLIRWLILMDFMKGLMNKTTLISLWSIIFWMRSVSWGIIHFKSPKL